MNRLLVILGLDEELELPILDTGIELLVAVAGKVPAAEEMETAGKVTGVEPVENGCDETMYIRVE